MIPMNRPAMTGRYTVLFAVPRAKGSDLHWGWQVEWTELRYWMYRDDFG